MTPTSSPSTSLDPALMTPEAVESIPLPFLLSFATSNTHRSIPYTFGFATSPPEALPELTSLFDDANTIVDSHADKTDASGLLNNWTQARDDLNASRKLFCAPAQQVLSQDPWSSIAPEHPVSTYGSWGFEEMDSFMTCSVSCSNDMKQGFSAQTTSSVSEMGNLHLAAESFAWPYHDDTVSIQSRLDEISTQLVCYCMSLPQGHFASTEYVKMNLAGRFFKVVNLQTALPTYFHHFHRHCPAVHPATFKPQQASAQLLLAVFLAGTFYTSSQAQLDIARNYLDLIDEFVQNCSNFKEMLAGKLRDSEDAQREYVETLQAAIIIFMLQDNEGTPEAQGRLRAQNFPKFITCCRALKLLSAKSSFFQNDTFMADAAFEWEDFVLSETRLRIVQLTCWMDFEFCVFYNLPARLTMAEITAELPCSEHIFESRTWMQCFQELCRQPPKRRCTLSLAMRLILASSWDEKSSEMLIDLPTLSLFTMITALNALAWMAQGFFLDDLVHERVEVALTRWKVAWDKHQSRLAPDEFKRLGVPRHSLEMWWLGKVLLQLAKHEQTALVSTEVESTFEHCGNWTRDIKDIIVRFGKDAM